MMTNAQLLTAYQTIANLMQMRKEGRSAQKAFDSAVTTAHSIGLTDLGIEIHRLKIPEENHLQWLHARIRTLQICEQKMRPEFISQVIKHLHNDTISLENACLMAYEHLGTEYGPSYVRLLNHIKATLGTCSFASHYAAKYGRKGADLREKRIQWMAACLANAHAGVEFLPEVLE